jgi:predicted HTH domain antitoxin
VPKLVLEIPARVADALRLPSEEMDQQLRTELALALYQRGVLSGGKSRELAGMTRYDFDQLLGRRKVVRHYTATDLTEDLEYAERC